MKFTHALTALSLASGTVAQVFAPYTDENSISFWQSTWDTTLAGGASAQWGLALPPVTETTLANEYIGRIVVPRVSTGTWMGVTHESEMTNSLILLTWLDGEKVMTSFRYASGYVAPSIYTGNATLAEISSSVNDTHYELTYRCIDCWQWNQAGATGSQVPSTTSAAVQLIGWAQATQAPANPSEADSSVVQHANDGIFGAAVASARGADYTAWAALATSTIITPPSATATGIYTNGTSSTNSTAAAPTAAACPPTNKLANSTFDYVIVGAGAGGIATADRLSEAGHSVLLIEKGPPSSGRWGGTIKPTWLDGTNLTRFDVPGLDNEIWADSNGIACSDYSVMAGCVLGGGTAVNAGLWWRANPADFDYNFPAGWKSADMQPAIDRVFERIPFTDRPSMDGVLYKPEGYNIIGNALAAAGWANVTADDEPSKKNWTFSHPNEMFSGGERGGPLATYLVTASERKNFVLITNTSVNRVTRDGSRITGVELEAFLDGGECGNVKVTPKTGKVILSAGAFGTPKILFRSGIGPQDQLEVVSKAEGAKMVNSSQWINLPVGYNLDDHVNTDIVITHPNVSFYDFYAAYDKPIQADADLYLTKKSGILAQSAPNLAAMFWEEITGADGVVRQIQWNARVETAHSINSTKAMTISQYLGRGATSRGRTTISAALDMTVSTVPYLNDAEDLAAVATGIENLKVALSKDPAIKFMYPASNQTTAEFLAAYPLTTGSRSANHWMGSAKMGLDSGLVNNGTSVVDTNTKVYGTDNLFVVDASVFPGMTTTNPSALIVSVAEHAAPLIMAFDASKSSVVTTGQSANSTAPYANHTLPASTSTACKVTLTLTRSAASTGSLSFHSAVYSANSTVAAAPTAASSTTKCKTQVTITRSTTSLASATEVAPASSMPAETSGSATVDPVSATSATQCSTKVTIHRSRTGSVYPTGAVPSAAAPVAPIGGNVTIAKYQKCGGLGYTGSKLCDAGLTCKSWNEYYSQCISSS